MNWPLLIKLAGSCVGLFVSCMFFGTQVLFVESGRAPSYLVRSQPIWFVLSILMAGFILLAIWVRWP